MGYKAEIRLSHYVARDCCPATTTTLPGPVPDDPKKIERVAKQAGWSELRENSLSTKGNVCHRSWTEYHLCPACQKRGRTFKHIQKKVQADYRRQQAKAARRKQREAERDAKRFGITLG